MIHKVEKLTSIGKFRDYQATGDVAFKKLTLIYAENGSGKTTLTAVLRSLALNDSEIIERRASTNLTLPQSSQIIQRDALGTDINHNFGRNGWSNQFANIEIFDIHFINENIYSGFEFTEDHKKQLHQFVIGAQGVGIQQQIEANKLAKIASRHNITNYESQIKTLVGNGLTDDMVNAFVSITVAQSNDIDSLITNAEITLASAKANGVIQTLHVLSAITPFNHSINFASVIVDIQTTIQSIQNTIMETLFGNHCLDLVDNGIEDAEQWLKKGFDYIQTKGTTGEANCPFCKQPVNNTIDILNAYSNKFNLEFQQLIERLGNHLTAIQNLNLEAFIERLNNTNENNIAYISTWTPHLPTSTQAPIYNIIANEVLLKTQFQNVIDVLNQKLRNPSIANDITQVSALEDSLQVISDNIIAYNESIVSYNDAISLFRSRLQNEVQAQNEVNRLKRIKKRFETNIDPLCVQLVAEKNSLRSLESAYTQLSQQQETEATLFFTNYKDRINHYLGTVFRTPFRIDEVRHVPPQGRAVHSKMGYKLTLDGQDISFDPTQPKNAKDSLSEGDKSTIALAFFLSKLDIDALKNDKILVFDDPLSSLDNNRRLYTVQLIRDLLQDIKQVMVLSHNEFFLYELSKGVSASEKKYLRIREDFSTNASYIEPLDLDTLVEIEYFKNIKELENFIQHADITRKDTVLGLMRNVLEAHIRFKFYRQLAALQPNRQTLGNLILELNKPGVTYRVESGRTDINAKLNLINGISCKPHHGEPTPDYGSLGVNPNIISVTELVNFVRDTLDLIDNKL